MPASVVVITIPSSHSDSDLNGPTRVERTAMAADAVPPRLAQSAALVDEETCRPVWTPDVYAHFWRNHYPDD
jgi:hypothetical protein